MGIDYLIPTLAIAWGVLKMADEIRDDGTVRLPSKRFLLVFSLLMGASVLLQFLH